MPYPLSQQQALPLTITATWLNMICRLSRLKLSTMVALSGLSGYLFARQGWNLDALLVFISLLLLAAGCSGLNQWQERDIDRLMERTRRRPIPSGQLSPAAALSLSLGMLSLGLLILMLQGLIIPLLLGAFSILWYNGIYTRLKRTTAFAVLPGALCGAIPPLIGWCAVGRSPLDYPVVILAGTLFLWQIPHFWLLACCYAEDHDRSGLPNLFERISHDRLFLINCCWLAALGLCYLLFPLMGLLRQPLLCTLFLMTLPALGLIIFNELRKGAKRASARKLFHLLNGSMALLLISLLLDNLI